ncbi:Glycine/betaine ABC transporter substrate-binding protein [Candidatus Hydrogenisulfobacillus filiaventi]|uniref:Glycine/betaine ABC transporter substrate-binding protein n=1 Tax=Candidatus Hydrogenisulfobacillus filiaventi TaxID=2707344 RepID=A0A6F8ZJX5_9FIRM|nr:ABC transporter substrate-binding protein [Bacillota bacterium]CAB1130181.1 Glycine/betaine ABC transporter substrate-binding protein [Candidatus Hydrogenisulfobacillus filiaventi]
MARRPQTGRAAAVAALLAGSLLAGCGRVAAGPTVTIGYENAPDPEAVAIARGYFQRDLRGAHVVLKYFASGPAALSALASGRLQFMTTLGNPPTVSAIADGVPLEVIWAMERYTTAEGLVVRNGSGITSLAGLEGRSVALVQGSTSPFELATALRLHHLNPGRVHLINMSPQDMVNAWRTGRIDAAYVWVPFFTAMQRDSGRVLLYDQDVAQAAPIFNLAVVNTGFARAHPGLVEDFIRAEAAGYRFYRAHPRQAYADMARVNGITPAEARNQARGLAFTSLAGQLSLRRLGTTATVGRSLVTRSLTAAAAWLAATGTIARRPPDLARYVNPAYVEAVLGRQGGHGG